jgi:hypothetical protein
MAAVTSMPAAERIVAAAAAWGLPGRVDPSPVVVRDEMAVAVRSLARVHRVQGLLSGAVQAGAVVGAEDFSATVLSDHVEALRTCLAAEATAVEVVAVLAEAGVRPRVLKGVAIAHVDHPDPAQRVFGDIDLMIRRSDLPAALGALGAAGFVRTEPAVRDWWERRYSKAVVLRSPIGVEVDLHLGLVNGFFGVTIDPAELLDRTASPFTVAGTELEALDGPARLLHAAVHVVLGAWSGDRALRDVAQLVLVSRVDWTETAALAFRWRADAVVAEGVRRAWTALGLDPEHPAHQWAVGLRVSDEQRRAMARYASSHREGYRHEALSTLPALALHERALFLAGLAWPSAASRRARRRSMGGHLRHGARAVTSS